MANHKSAKKRARQTETRTARNRQVEGRTKTAVRDFRTALQSGDAAKAKEALSSATRALRKAASKGVLTKATVSRRVSRLSKAFNGISAS